MFPSAVRGGSRCLDDALGGISAGFGASGVASLFSLAQDADNLQKINAAAISKGIMESCSVLLYLNFGCVSGCICSLFCPYFVHKTKQRNVLSRLYGLDRSRWKQSLFSHEQTLSKWNLQTWWDGKWNPKQAKQQSRNISFSNQSLIWKDAEV